MCLHFEFISSPDSRVSLPPPPPPVTCNLKKVLQNAGILYRRERDLNEAHKLFTRARDIDPGFCDVWYWIGINAINLGDTDTGMRELREAVDCKYQRVEAVKSLHALYAELFRMQVSRDP